MTTLQTLDEKLATLGGEMKTQTQQLGNIALNTQTMAAVALSDQKARDEIYSRLADGLLKISRLVAGGFIVLLVLALIATFKQEVTGSFKGSALHIGTTNNSLESIEEKGP